MAIQRPDPTDMARVVERYGLGLAEDDLEQFGPVVEGLLSSWDVVAENGPSAASRHRRRGRGRADRMHTSIQRRRHDGPH